MLSTKTSKGILTAEEKQDKIQAAREFHSALLTANGVELKDFNLKYSFKDRGQLIVAIFPSEFKKSNGFFFELTDSNLNPVDAKRTVYKVNSIDNYEDIYNILQSGAYAVPLEEIEVVEEKVKAPTFQVDMSTLNKVKDENISNMTITDFAAIMWMKPVSEKDWLNSLINQNI